jgi:excisionase family DNA binding protein
VVRWDREPAPPLTVEQVAERLGKSVYSVRREIQRGKLRAFNVGTGRVPRYRISREALRAYEERTAGGRIAHRAGARAQQQFQH